MSNTGPAISEEQLRLLKELRKLNTDIGLTDENIRKIRKEILMGMIRETDELKKQVDLTYGLQESEEDRLNAINEIVGLEKQMIKPLTKIATLTDESYELEKKKLQQLKEQAPEMEKSVDNLLKQLETLNKISKNPIAKAGFAAAGDTINEMQNGIDSFMNKLPGGKTLSKLFGIDKIGENLQNQLVSGFESSIAKGSALVAGAAVFAALYAVLTKISAEAEEFAKETGVTFGQARMLADESRNVAQNLNLQLATSKDILAVQQETIKTFGTTAMLTGEQAANVADLGKSFGYGAQQAAQVNNAFMSMGASASDAYEAQQSLAAEALKAGVNVGAVTKDIVENAKVTSKYFGGNVTALKNAAIEAAKMGMNLQTMTKIADQLLNIESSLTAQFEFQALSGRQIDLDLARQLALTGDIAGASREVLVAVGCTAEFNQLSVLEKKKLAEATGMEVDELQKSLVIQEKLGDLTEDQLAAMSGLNLSAAELNSKSPEQLQALLAQQQTLQKSQKVFADIGDKLLVALTPAAEIFGEALANIAPLLKLAVPVLTIIGKLVHSILAPFMLMNYIIDKIQEGITYLMEQFTWLQPTIDVISTVFSVIFDVISSIGGVLGGVLIPYMAVLAAKAVVGAYKMVAQAIAGIFTTFSGLPFGMGIPLAFGAAGALVALVSKFTTKTGDLAMGANNGPIVANPREGTIFQGTKNDEVAMGPGVIGAAQGEGQGLFGSLLSGISSMMGPSDAQLMNALMVKIDQLIVATNNSRTAVINWSDRDTTQVANAVAADRTVRATYNGR